MRNICMTVSYDGTRYYGFQTQPGGNTIQDAIEQGLYTLTGERIKITSSGRTDAGVHARAQVINFVTSSKIPVERWAMALNSRLPEDIRIRDAREVPMDFHARKSAVKKTYCYTIHCARIPDVFHRHIQFHHPAPLDAEAMRNGLQWIVGEHDFTSFCSIHSTQLSHVRTIYDAKLVYQEEDALMKLYFTGNGFLQHMVRILVGTLIEIGEGKRKSSEMRDILLAKDRSKAGPTAMPHGLMLWEVFYQ